MTERQEINRAKAIWAQARYARDPEYRLRRMNHVRSRIGLPLLTLDQMPPYQPYRRKC